MKTKNPFIGLPYDLVYLILEEFAQKGKLRRGSSLVPARFMFRVDPERVSVLEGKLRFPVQTVGFPSKPQHRLILPINYQKYFEIRRSETGFQFSVYDDPHEYLHRKTVHDTWKLREMPQKTILFEQEFGASSTRIIYWASL